MALAIVLVVQLSYKIQTVHFKIAVGDFMNEIGMALAIVLVVQTSVKTVHSFA